jgi:hypothetical protein
MGHRCKTKEAHVMKKSTECLMICLLMLIAANTIPPTGTLNTISSLMLAVGASIMGVLSLFYLAKSK